MSQSVWNFAAKQAELKANQPVPVNNSMGVTLAKGMMERAAQPQTAHPIAQPVERTLDHTVNKIRAAMGG